MATLRQEVAKGIRLHTAQAYHARNAANKSKRTPEKTEPARNAATAIKAMAIGAKTRID